tara:strand:- start:160 stop:309 length:150 start_codon:yes stop_codon:yes gene_type:complete
MALLSSDMIRDIRTVAEEYSRQERERRARVAASVRADRQQGAVQVQERR